MSKRDSAGLAKGSGFLMEVLFIEVSGRRLELQKGSTLKES
jgi:hypothetical protein